jgi:hypothetical protein
MRACVTMCARVQGLGLSRARLLERVAQQQRLEGRVQLLADALQQHGAAKLGGGDKRAGAGAGRRGGERPDRGMWFEAQARPEARPRPTLSTPHWPGLRGNRARRRWPRAGGRACTAFSSRRMQSASPGLNTSSWQARSMLRTHLGSTGAGAPGRGRGGAGVRSEGGGEGMGGWPERACCGPRASAHVGMASAVEGSAGAPTPQNQVAIPKAPRRDARLTAWPWGSTMSGHRRARAAMRAFSMLRASLGSPSASLRRRPRGGGGGVAVWRAQARKEARRGRLERGARARKRLALRRLAGAPLAARPTPSAPLGRGPPPFYPGLKRPRTRRGR